MLQKEEVKKELTLDEVYLQNKKILDSRKKPQQKKEEPSFLRRFCEQFFILFFE